MPGNFKRQVCKLFDAYQEKHLIILKLEVRAEKLVFETHVFRQHSSGGTGQDASATGAADIKIEFECVCAAPFAQNFLLVDVEVRHSSWWTSHSGVLQRHQVPGTPIPYICFVPRLVPNLVWVVMFCRPR